MLFENQIIKFISTSKSENEACKAQLEEKEGLFNCPSSITVNVISARTDEYKAWRDKNLSGRYHLLEFYNERPVYKVSFI